MDFGTLLRARRQQAGLRLEAVAVAVDCSANTVKNWEQGRATPRLPHYLRLCLFFPGLDDEVREIAS